MYLQLDEVPGKAWVSKSQIQKFQIRTSQKSANPQLASFSEGIEILINYLCLQIC
jgi:hypothetical protein